MEELKVAQTVNHLKYRIRFRWIITAGLCNDSYFPLDVAVLGNHDVTVSMDLKLS